jgi:hypothetical protein
MWQLPEWKCCSESPRQIQIKEQGCRVTSVGGVICHPFKANEMMFRKLSVISASSLTLTRSKTGSALHRLASKASEPKKDDCGDRCGYYSGAPRKDDHRPTPDFVQTASCQLKKRHPRRSTAKYLGCRAIF